MGGTAGGCDSRDVHVIGLDTCVTNDGVSRMCGAIGTSRLHCTN